MSWLRGILPLAGSILALGACGGDSGGGGSPIVVTPSPTPTPTPKPAPTPTPTPTAIYPSATDFTRDRSFDAIGLRVITALITPTARNATMIAPSPAIRIQPTARLRDDCGSGVDMGGVLG